MILGMLTIANLFLKSRLKHVPKPFRVMEFVSNFKEIRFVFVSMASFFFFLGIFLPTNFIILQGQANGVSRTLSPYLLPILNAARYALPPSRHPCPNASLLFSPAMALTLPSHSIFGRIISGRFADVFGRFNVMLATTLVTAILVLALWLPASGPAALIVFAILFGYTSGTYVANTPAVVAQISDIRAIGVRNGTNFFFVSFAALIGNPIAGALIARDRGGYRYMQAFCGATMMLGFALFIAARSVQVGFKWTKI